jgi:branched-chain amino acid transport system permease protein
MISTFLVGVLGGLYAHYILYIDASAEAGGVLSMVLGLESAIVTMLGGIGEIYGPIVGAFIRQTVGEFLRVKFGQTGGGDLLILGIILIIIILVMPKGIYGTLRNKFFAKGGS